MNRYSDLDITVNTGSEKRAKYDAPRFIIEIREKATGEIKSRSVPMNVERLPDFIDSMIIMNLAHTKAAEAIRTRRGMYPVKLRERFDEYLFTDIHNALRKHCDGSASSLWWNFFQDCHPMIINEIVKNSCEQLMSIKDKRHTLIQAAEHLKIGWKKLLEDGCILAEQLDPKHDYWLSECSNLDNDAQLRIREMGRDELSRFRKDLRTASMMLDYLNNEDWKAMASSLVQDD